MWGGGDLGEGRGGGSYDIVGVGVGVWVGRQGAGRRFTRDQRDLLSVLLLCTYPKFVDS